MKRSLAGLLILMTVFAAPAAPADAHRMHAALTLVEPNPRTGAIEIMHRLVAHDLEIALASITDKNDPYGQPDIMKVIGGYVAARFGLYDGEGEPIELTFVGAEPEADLIWVYFEAPPLEGGSTIYMRNDLLFDAFADQINQANLTFGDITKTLIFSQPDDIQGVEF